MITSVPALVSKMQSSQVCGFPKNELFAERAWTVQASSRGSGSISSPRKFLNFALLDSPETHKFIKPSTFTPSIWRVKEFYDYKHF